MATARRSLWSDEETQNFLRLLKEHRAVDPNGNIAKYDILVKIAKLMSVLGYDRNAEQLRFKLKNLRRLYVRWRGLKFNPSHLKGCGHSRELIDLFGGCDIVAKGSRDEPNGGLETPEGSTLSDRDRWRPGEIRDLLELAKDYNFSGENGSVPACVPKEMVERFRAKGHDRTAHQIYTKLKKLRKFYNDCLKGTITTPLFVTLAQVFGWFAHESEPTMKEGDLDTKSTVSNRRSRLDTKRIASSMDNEIVSLLKLIRQSDYYVTVMENGVDSRTAEALSKIMMEWGSCMKPDQIKIIMQNLRMSYAQCRRSGCTPAAMKDCPYYDRLYSIFGYYLDNVHSDTDDENNDTTRERVNLWHDDEIRKMFAIIDELDLAHELSTGSCLGALRILSRALKANGCDKSVEQVKAALTSLRTSYAACKRAGCDTTALKNCPYYDHLDEIWGKGEDTEQDFRKFKEEPDLNVKTEKVKSHNVKSHIVKSQNVKGQNVKSHNVKERERGEFWSEEETIVLLTSITELDIVEDTLKNSDYAAGKLFEALKDSGYVRTKTQIRSKLKNLRRSYITGKRMNCLERAIRLFPFYHRYESIFGHYLSNLDTNSLRYEGDENMREDSDQMHLENEESLSIDKKKHNRSPAWTEEETILVLALIRDTNLVEDIKERMTLEVVSKLVKPLEAHGFLRTASQIKTKLKNLRTSYHRCNLAGRTPKALAECPFYNRLHAIFQRQVVVKKLETVRTLEPVDHSYVNAVEASTDHSYVNILNPDELNNVSNNSTEEKCKIEEPQVNEVWFPVETIVDTVHFNSGNDESAPSSPRAEVEQAEDVESEEADGSVMMDFEEVDEEEIFELKKEMETLVSPQRIEASEQISDEFVSPEQKETPSPVSQNVLYDQEADARLATPKVHSTRPRTTLLGKFTSSEAMQTRSFTRKQKFKRSEDSKVDQPGSAHAATDASPRLRGPVARRERLGNSIPYSLKNTHEPIYVKGMKAVMADVLKHEKWMQQQHHMWMERQFEIQRKHDRDQRELLLNELREFRRSITSTIYRREFFGDN